MTWTSDKSTAEWFESVLFSASPLVRRRAVEVLARVDCPRRGEWLAELTRDPDASVAGAAVLAQAAVTVSGERERHLELFESEIAEYMGPRSDLEWEWEYEVRMCSPGDVPLASTWLWLEQEDDQTAREVALMRGGGGEPRHVAVIVGKRLVNCFTRRPRNGIEARRWHRFGRPRYNGDERL